MVNHPLKDLEERLGILYHIARKYKYINHWETDELVNQMWLSETVRTTEWSGMVVKAAYAALFDYFTHEIKRRCHGDCVPEDISTKVLLDLMKMDFDELSKGLSRTQKLIIKLRCEGYSLPKIARIIGLAGESGVRKHLKNIDKERFIQWIAA